MVWEGFGEGFGKILDALGVFWAAFWLYLFMLAFRVVFKRALGAFWARFWRHFGGFGRDLGFISRGFGLEFTFKIRLAFACFCLLGLAFA